MIPDNIIEDIKMRNDIADVIGTYVTLKRAGSNMTGLCPFHNEKTPSFVVFRNTQTFYCFGCGAAGDVVTFVRKSENLEYVEALHYLARRVGITIPEDDNNRGRVRRSRILEINKAAARFFRSQLLTSNEAKQYIIKRGLTKKAVDRFGLGYSAKGYELIDHLRKNGYTEDEMVAAKLAGKNEKGYYPFFRERVMFPIIDTSGSVIGFGGRVLDDRKPKYLNTPDTPAFNKGRNLFALNYAKEHANEFMILCEGYMDVIALHNAGFENAVATLGTAITSEQARLIKRYTGKVVISYDGDGAGRRATDRAADILGEAGIDVRVLNITGAKDPDEYIKLYGADAFNRLLNGSDTKFDYVMKNVLAKYDIETVDGKIKASKELCGEIASVPSSVEREIYVEKVAKRLGLTPQSIEEDVKKALKAKNKERTANFDKQLQNKAMGVGDRINPEYSANPKAAAAEEAILGILMLYPEKITKILSGKIELIADDFVTKFNRRVFEELLRLHSEGVNDVGALGAIFTPEEMNRVFEIQMKRNGLESSNDEVLLDNITVLRNAKAVSQTDIDKLIASKRGTTDDKK
jgi:DNA primase